MADLSPFEQSEILRLVNPALYKRAARTHDIKLSMDVSIGFVLRDLRKDDSPGVKAIELDGICTPK